jgi:poly-beta-1,6-N-acetyl-D-glucosamine synthase
MEVFFWLLITLILYTYGIYPIVLFFLSKLKNPLPDSRELKNEVLPKVDLLIAAYNEEKVIEYKLKNSLNLDYPKELLNIWIASDGSVDRTNEIVKKYSNINTNVHLIEFPRTGKSGVLNKSLEHLKGDIIVFSDANTEYLPDAIKKLVKHYNNPAIGCVSGRLYYRNPGEIVSGKGESFYWRYENSLKRIESKIGYIAGANGAIYSIRRSLFEPFPTRTVNDDFTASMKIVEKGYKSIYEEGAEAYEDVAPSTGSEFRRHIRDGAGHYIAIFHLLKLLNPFLGIRSFIYWSHRIIRWLVPFFMIFIFLLNILLLNNTFYQTTFILQCLFYLFAILGWLSIKYTKLPFFLYIPFYYCNLNLALFLGFIKSISNTQKTTWERTERT